MIEITPTPISHNLQTFFANAIPLRLRCQAVLQGNAAGRILVDDPVQPTYAIVQEPGDGAVYLGGAVTAPILAEAIHRLRQHQEAVLVL